MSQRRRSPQEKKRDRYDHDYVVAAEYSLRKAWPRKKRHANQRTRAHTRDVLNTIVDEQSLEAFPPELVATRPRRVHRKWVLSVRERVERQLELRRSRLGWNFFKQPYRERSHRERFSAFIRALIAERRGEAKHHARVVRWWLDGSPVPGGRSMHPGRLEWLRSFFAHEPGLERLLRQWVGRTLAGE